MLKKKPPTIDGMTVIHEGTKINGDVKVTGSIRIDGEVEGNIAADGNVYIGKEGKVTGNIESENATLEGALTGNLKVSEHAVFTSTSLFRGELSYKTCEVERGARLNSTMKSEVQDVAEHKERGFAGKLLSGMNKEEGKPSSDSKTA